jgi:hypothetical protein
MKILGFIVLCATLVSASSLYAEETPVETVMDFIKGVFKAMNEQHKFDAVEKCIKESEPLLKEYIKIWNKIIELDPTKIMEIVNLVITAYNHTVAYIKSCSGAVDELKKLANAFVKIDFQKLIFKLFTEYQTLIKYVTEIINAATTFDAGKAFGHLIYKFILDGVLMQAPMFNFSSFVDIVEGYFQIIVNKTVFDNIHDCLKRFPHIYTEFITAIEKLKHLDIKKPLEIIDAIQSLFKAIVSLLNATKGCSKMPEVFEEMIKKFIETPIQEIYQRLMKRFPMVFGAVYSIVNAIQTQNFHEVGTGIGKIVLMLIYDKDRLESLTF